MRKRTKVLTVLLSVLLLLSVMSVPALAEAPNATVTELTGSDLSRTLDGFDPLTGLNVTMSKAVRFLATEAQNEEYGDYYCDFELTLTTPNQEPVDGSQFLLVGEYESMGCFGLPVSGEVPNGTYKILEWAFGNPITYNDVLAMQRFDCGIVDIDLPVGTQVDIQLMMYPPDKYGVPDAAIQIGDTITYAPISIAKIDAYVGNDGLGNLRFVTNVNYNENHTVEYYGTWFLPENLLNTDKPKVQLETTGQIASGSNFKADLVGIPASQLARQITGVSYVKYAGIVDAYTVQKTTCVNDNRNWTSK